MSLWERMEVVSKAFSTVPKIQVGKSFLLQGRILIVALRNFLIKGSSAHLRPVNADNADTCTLIIL